MKAPRFVLWCSCILLSSFCVSEGRPGRADANRASADVLTSQPTGESLVVTKVLLHEQNVVNNSGIVFGPDGTAYVGTWGKATISRQGPLQAVDPRQSYSNGKIFAVSKNGTLKWEYDPGFASDFDQNLLRHFGTIESSPKLDPDDPSILYFGRGDGRLFCIQDQGAQKPRTVWEYDATQECTWGKYLGVPVRGGQIFCSPAVGTDGAVYFGITKLPGTATALYAVDKITGKLRWRYPKQGSLPTTKMVLNPALRGDHVLFTAGPCIYAFRLDQDDHKGALEPSWTYELEPSQIGGRGDFYFGNPAIRNSTLYVAAMDQMSRWTGIAARLFALDVRTGHLLWNAPYVSNEAVLHGPTLDDGNRIYLGGGDWYKSHSGPLTGTLCALLDRGKDWKVLWSVSFDAPVSAPALKQDGRCYFGLKGDPRKPYYQPASVYSYTTDGKLSWGPVKLDAPTAATPITIDPSGRLYVADAPCQDLSSDCLNSGVRMYILK